MNKYSEMSDFEINKAVAIIEGHKCYYDNGTYTNGLDANRAVVKGNGIIGGFNPCNSWVDAGPIIAENLIGITPMLSGWKAAPERSPSGFKDYTSAAHSNPLRAAMIVFLMMQESTNEC